MNDDYKLYARDFPESTIIEQYYKYGCGNDEIYTSVMYEVINDAFMVVEHLSMGEWKRSGVGGGEWINKDESLFKIIDHGIRSDW